MMASARILAAGAAMFVWIAFCGFASTPSKRLNADIIVTASPFYKPLAELQGGERFPNGAQLLLVHNGVAKLLVHDFAATADADVSYDGKFVLFSGKKAESDPWQIWELTLLDGSLRKVVTSATDAQRPFYLPGGRLIWAERTSRGFRIESDGDGHAPAQQFLNPSAGPGVLPLTYTRGSAFPTDVLADGRILFESGFPLSDGSIPDLYLVYADGSGVESYRCDHGRARWGGRQLASGDVVFTHGRSLARFTSPLAHEQPIAAPRGEYSGAIVEAQPDAWLVSARLGADAHFSLKSWKPGAVTMETILAQRNEDIVEPVLVAAHTRPNRHPSGLHPWDYANLLVLDARLSRDGNLKTAPSAVRLEMQNENGAAVSIGTAPVESDGSFFVKVPADKPVRFALLDGKGSVLRREQGWFWIRKGEQRICVGCHTGPERASENRVPAVLLRTTTPFDLTGQAPAAGAPQKGQ